MDLDMHLSAIDSELNKAENMLTQYNMWFTNLMTIALGTKADSPQ